jgi:hypothetical protein
VSEDHLKRWLRLDTTNEPFPREVGKYRDVVYSYDEFLKWYRVSVSRDDCWASIYSTDQINRRFFDTYFLDFDFKEGWDVKIGLLKELLDILVTMFPRVRLYYSGMKGFHVYLDFGEEFFFYNFKETAREFYQKVVANYLEADTAVIGDYRRVARVVGNVRKSGKMVELDPFDQPEVWTRMIRSGRSCDCDGEPLLDRFSGVKMLTQIDEERAKVMEEEVEARILSRVSLDRIPPCIVRCFTELVETGELDHMGRVLLANWLIWAGFEEDEVVDVFRVANDFKEHYTRYQVQFLMRKMYKLPSCRKIMALGFCPYKCELYPWMQASRGGEGS